MTVVLMAFLLTMIFFPACAEGRLQKSRVLQSTRNPAIQGRRRDRPQPLGAVASAHTSLGKPRHISYCFSSCKRTGGPSKSTVAPPSSPSTYEQEARGGGSSYQRGTVPLTSALGGTYLFLSMTRIVGSAPFSILGMFLPVGHLPSASQHGRQIGNANPSPHSAMLGRICCEGKARMTSAFHTGTVRCNGTTLTTESENGHNPGAACGLREVGEGCNKAGWVWKGLLMSTTTPGPGRDPMSEIWIWLRYTSICLISATWSGGFSRAGHRHRQRHRLPTDLTGGCPFSRTTTIGGDCHLTSGAPRAKRGGVPTTVQRTQGGGLSTTSKRVEIVL